jgi:CRP-like cAMP-binding protein
MSMESLRFLTHDDRRLLLGASRQATYRYDEEIIAEGSPQQALYVIREGQVRIEYSGLSGTSVVARLQAGEVFGEMSFVDQRGASAAVVADGDVLVDVIEREQMNALLYSVPGLAARFFQSLAVTLSQRLREARTPSEG